MDFNQVRYFLALANTLNFTRAAEQCNVSQPALTQAIRRLETELGGDLVDREGRRIELTPLGNHLRGYFAQIDRTRKAVNATATAVTSGTISELNIGLMCTIGPRVIAPMIDAFRNEHPRVSIILHDVTVDSAADLVLTGALDGSFCAHRNPPTDEIAHIDLFEERLVVAMPVGHAFEGLDEVPLREIANQRYLDRLHCEFREDVLEYYRGIDLDLDVIIRSEREDWIQGMVRDGAGISCIPRYSLLEPELTHRPIVDPELSRSVSFAYAKRPGTPRALENLIAMANSYDWPKPAEPSGT